MTVRPFSATAEADRGSHPNRNHGGHGAAGGGQARISYSVWPDPRCAARCRGCAERSCIDSMFSWARSFELRAVIAIGVACTVDSRFSP